MVHVALYADENYLDDGYIFMGGYVASVDAWLKIVDPWKAILAEPPGVAYFSNHGFKSAKWCQQNGVSLNDMELLPAKTVKLAGVIANSDILFPAYSRMWRSHFDQEIKRRVRALKNPKYELLRDPYYFCYTRLLSVLLNQLTQINSCLSEGERLSPLDVFVDDNGKLAEEASKLFHLIKEQVGPLTGLMGTAVPLDDKTTIPLQCADLYVGQHREYYANNIVSDAMEILIAHPFKPPFVSVGRDYTREQLRQFAATCSGLPERQWLK